MMHSCRTCPKLMFKELIIAIDHELIALQACTIHCATITR